MLTHFGTLFVTWHIYHYLTQMFHVEQFCTIAQISLHNCANRQQTIQMFHVEQRNMSLTIFNKEIFKNIWNVTKNVVTLHCNKERDINN